MLILLVNDIHATERPPSSCTDTYLDDLIGLLMQTVDGAKVAGVRAVVWAGDVFHHKAPSRSSHRLVQILINVIKSYPCPVFIVPGNHDLQYDRLDSISVTQPLGVLLRAGAILLNGWGGYDADTQYPLFGIPWQQGYGNYHETGEDVDGALGVRFGQYHQDRMSGKVLVVTHAPLYPPGQELPYEYFPAQRWAEGMGGEGYCWYGHVHERHGVWQAGGVTFANFGALSRGSIHEHNLTRKVAVGVWNSDTGEFAEVPLNARPPEEVFRLAERAQVTDMTGRLDAFLEQAGSAALAGVSIEEVMGYIRSRDLDPKVVELAEELLASAQAERNR